MELFIYFSPCIWHIFTQVALNFALYLGFENVLWTHSTKFDLLLTCYSQVFLVGPSEKCCFLAVVVVSESNNHHHTKQTPSLYCCSGQLSTQKFFLQTIFILWHIFVPNWCDKVGLSLNLVCKSCEPTINFIFGHPVIVV